MDYGLWPTCMHFWMIRRSHWSCSQGRCERASAPGGQRTTLAYGPDGYLSAIADPASETYAFTYKATDFFDVSTGLLATFTTPLGQTHTSAMTPMAASSRMPARREDRPSSRSR